MQTPLEASGITREDLQDLRDLGKRRDMKPMEHTDGTPYYRLHVVDMDGDEVLVHVPLDPEIEHDVVTKSPLWSD